MDSTGHRVQAERFESFLRKMSAAAPEYQEWSVIVRYYAALHYVDAFLTTQRPKTWERHDDRLRFMRQYPETQAIEPQYHRIQKLSREARYDGTPFTERDISGHVAPLYDAVRGAIRAALRLGA